MSDAARHQALKEQLLDLAIEALPPGEARAVEAHAAGCAECRAELASLRGVKAQVAALPPIEAPARGEAILLAAARQAAEEAAARRRPWLPSWRWSAALGGVGVAAVAVLAIRLTTGAPGPLDAAREREAAEGAPAGLARPREAQDAFLPASPPAPAQAEAEAKQEAAPAPATLAPAPPPRSARSDADAGPLAASEAGRAELRAAPAPGRARLAEAPAVALAPPPAPAAAPAAEQEAGRAAGPGRGAIGFAASNGGPPAPDRASSTAARKLAPAASREEASAALADAAAPRAAAAPAASSAEAAEAGAPAERSADPRLQAETRTDPACAAEQRRTLWRDGAGAVVRRLRTGQHQGAPVLLDEAFGPDGRIVSARVEAAGRSALFGRAGLAAARFVPVPGLPVAATAAEAEAAPLACDAWAR